MGHWWNDANTQPEGFREKPFQCHFVHRRLHMAFWDWIWPPYEGCSLPKYCTNCPLSTLLLYFEDQSDNAVQEINHMHVENSAICIISCSERALPMFQSHHVARCFVWHTYVLRSYTYLLGLSKEADIDSVRSHCECVCRLSPMVWCGASFKHMFSTSCYTHSRFCQDWSI